MRLFSALKSLALPLDSVISQSMTDVVVCSPECQDLFGKWVDMKNDLHSGKLRI